MPQTDIGQATTTDLSGAMEDFSVASQVTDAQGEQKETVWHNENAGQYLGYYKEIPELRAVIDAKATWTVGKGFETDQETTLLLDQIAGFGKDTFNTILENLARSKEIYGDAFAEIIRDEENNLINLKPLDPAVIGIVVDNAGLIKNYEQNSKIKGKKPKKLRPDQILHIARNRVADEIHGTSLIESLEWVIKAKNETQADYKRVMHRNVEPLMVIHADTDDTTKLAKIKSDWEKIKKDGETWIVPKDVIVPELLATAPNATMNPLPWLEFLNNQFYQVSQVPQIILGGSGEFTEASAKIAYLAFQQNIEEEQLFLEEQLGYQLGINVKLTFPASLENELLSDNKKDGAQNIDPSETTAGQGQ